MWLAVVPQQPPTKAAPSRSTKILTAQLGIDTDDDDKLPDALPGGRELLLSSDFYVVYQILGRVDGVDNLWCWSHIRRYFIRAGDAHPELAAWTAGRIRTGISRVASRFVRMATNSSSEMPSWMWMFFSLCSATVVSKAGGRSFGG